MRYRRSQVAFCWIAFVALTAIFLHSSRNATEPNLVLPMRPAIGVTILSKLFEQNATICILSPYSLFGRLCYVPEDQIFIIADLSDSYSWKVEMNSTLQISSPMYHEIRYYNLNTCLQLDPLEEFHLMISSVKDLGADVEAVLNLKK